MILSKNSFPQRVTFFKNKIFKSKTFAPILFLPQLPLSLLSLSSATALMILIHNVLVVP